MMMFVILSKRMSRFSYRSAMGMGSSSQGLAGVLLYLKKNSSVAGSNVRVKSGKKMGEKCVYVHVLTTNYVKV